MKTSPIIVLASLCMATLTLHSQPVMHAQQKTTSGTFLQRKAQLTRSLNKTAALDNQVYFPDTAVLHSSNGTARISASYDQKGWTTQRLVEIWSGGQWVNFTLDSWTYFDANGNSIDLQQTWVSGHWVNSTLDSSTYDANGNMLVHLYAYWWNGQRKDSILSSRTYDANGKMLTNWSKLWSNGQWTNSYQATYTNDAQGNELTYLSEVWSSAQWVNETQWTFTYDGNGNALTWKQQWWQANPGGWVNISLASYTYDAQGNVLTIVVQSWPNGQLTNSNQTTYTYDAHGNRLTELSDEWSNGLWTHLGRSTNTYDANNGVLTHLYEFWHNSQWTNSTQGVFTYDTYGNELTGINTQWSNSSWVPADNTFTVYFYSDSSYYNFTGDSIRISYTLLNISDVSTKMSDRVSGYLLSQNYPNPFNPTTEVSYQLPVVSNVRLVVYDILGREVAVLVNEVKQPGTYTAHFDASGLASGVYFYRLTAGSPSTGPSSDLGTVSQSNGSGPRAESRGFAQTRKLCLLR